MSTLLQRYVTAAVTFYAVKPTQVYASEAEDNPPPSNFHTIHFLSKAKNPSVQHGHKVPTGGSDARIADRGMDPLRKNHLFPHSHPL